MTGCATGPASSARRRSITASCGRIASSSRRCGKPACWRPVAAPSVSRWGGRRCRRSSPRMAWRWWRPDPRWQRRAGARLDRNRPAFGSATEGLPRPGLLDRATFDELVGFRPADMARLPADLLPGGFDMVWSVCALEHLGKLDRGLAFVEAAMRCLKPGGIAVHTTEFDLDSKAAHAAARQHRAAAQRRHLDALAGRLAAAGHRMLPLDDGHGDGMLDRFVDLPPQEHEASPLGPVFPPHLRLSVRGFCGDLGGDHRHRRCRGGPDAAPGEPGATWRLFKLHRRETQQTLPAPAPLSPPASGTMTSKRSPMPWRCSKASRCRCGWPRWSAARSRR